MSARHPTPWRAEGRDNGKRGRQRREFWAVLDRNEFFVAENLDETTAREIVETVNERERLRDDVGWLLHFARMLMERYREDWEKGRSLGLIKPRRFASIVRKMDWIDGQLAEIRARVGEGIDTFTGEEEQ